VAAGVQGRAGERIYKGPHGTRRWIWAEPRDRRAAYTVRSLSEADKADMREACAPPHRWMDQKYHAKMR